MRSWTARRAGLVGFVVSAVAFVGIGGVTASRIVQLRAAGDAVEHTLLVRATADGLMSLLNSAEAAQRGFVITGLPQYAEPYHDAVDALPKRIAEFRRLTADNAVQQQNITAFEGLAVRRMTLLRESMGARQEYGFESAAREVAGGEGMRVMKAAREVVSKMVAEEDRLWHERGLDQRDQANRVIFAGLGGLAAALALLVVAAFFVARR